MKVKFILVLLVSCLGYCSSSYAEYRADQWDGRKSDKSVQKAGYAYYVCDQNSSDCYAIYLTDQDYQDLLRVLNQYRGALVEDAINMVGRDSDLAVRVLQDFKTFRRINSMKKVISILERKRNTSN